MTLSLSGYALPGIFLHFILLRIQILHNSQFWLVVESSSALWDFPGQLIVTNLKRQMHGVDELQSGLTEGKHHILGTYTNMRSFYLKSRKTPSILPNAFLIELVLAPGAPPWQHMAQGRGPAWKGCQPIPGHVCIYIFGTYFIMHCIQLNSTS